MNGNVGFAQDHRQFRRVHEGHPAQVVQQFLVGDAHVSRVADQGRHGQQASVSAGEWREPSLMSVEPPGLDRGQDSLWARLPTVYRRLGAPFGRQPPNSIVHIIIEAQEVTEHSSVQKSAVRVNVRDKSGLQFHVPKFVEYVSRGAQLLLRECMEIQDRQRFNVSDSSCGLDHCADGLNATNTAADRA